MGERSTGTAARAAGEHDRAAVLQWIEPRLLELPRRLTPSAPLLERPEAVADALAGRLVDGRPLLAELGLEQHELRSLERVVLVAAEDASHAAQVGRIAIESWARLPCESEGACELRHRDPVLTPRTLVVGVSHHGASTDTAAVLRLARAHGCPTLAVTGTGAGRSGDGAAGVLTSGGDPAAPESFVALAAVLAVLALRLADARQELTPAGVSALGRELQALPALIRHLLDEAGPLARVAARCGDAVRLLCVGSHVGLPVACEGVRQLRGAVRIPVEARSAGTPAQDAGVRLDGRSVVAGVATDSYAYDDVVRSLRRARLSGARTLAIASEGNDAIEGIADDVVFVPAAHPFVQALAAVVPLQLLAHRLVRAERGFAGAGSSVA